MKPVVRSSRQPSRESLKAISYEDTTAARPPIEITVAKPSQNSTYNGSLPPRLRKISKQKLSPEAARSKPQNDVRRDSGLAPSSSTTRDSRTTLATDVDVDSAVSIRHSLSVPSFSAENVASPAPQTTTEAGQSMNEQGDGLVLPQLQFTGLHTDIPSASFEDLTIPGQIDFSKRGSMLIGGKKANNAEGGALGRTRVVGSRRKQNPTLLSPPPTLPTRALSADDEALSQKVRSMYDEGRDNKPGLDAELDHHDGSNGIAEVGISIRKQIPQSSLRPGYVPETAANGGSNHRASPHAATSSSRRSSALKHEDNQLAGGIEDWENLNNDDVDRYGFIVQRRVDSRGSPSNSMRGRPSEPVGIQRVSTLLQLASEAPRRQRSKNRHTKRLTKSPTRSTETPSVSRPTSGLSRPVSSQSSHRTINGNQSRIRSAANRLPHNKDRRCVDGAGDMLTLPPGLADIAEDQEDGKVANDLKRREWEREEKWRKMAKIVRNDRNGGGMIFDFDTRNPKVIERTWKGIPDRWRATAWHAFLTASSKNVRGSASDDELIAIFKKLVDQGSPDDVQIDIDVPRTINSHIMFRRRYRGGQRLLFRVLHCLSIYFPDTGYVQGMAALAATLLCYFDEEMTFVMLIRMWQLRGLERLYKSGFEGLMQALEEFEKDWLGNGEVAIKLVSPVFPVRPTQRFHHTYNSANIHIQNELNISPTAYGTRWYLTLFNYSIPFPAQLRVWDVFMLLGDPDIPTPTLPPSSTSTSKSTNKIDPNTNPNPNPSSSFHGGLDVLHAASAALIDGTREILLDSDFENAMKVLTSWIPIKDEEMLMRVAHVEWKMRRKRRS